MKKAQMYLIVMRIKALKVTMDQTINMFKMFLLKSRELRCTMKSGHKRRNGIQYSRRKKISKTRLKMNK